MSKVEYLQGWRWAKDVCQSVKQSFKNWKPDLIETLERGLLEKPEDYKGAVSDMIALVRTVPDNPPIRKSTNMTEVMDSQPPNAAL